MMRQIQIPRHWRAGGLLLLMALPPAALPGGEQGQPAAWTAYWRDLWRTPDQQAQRLFDAGDYAAAAARFSDPMRIGAAWYRAGEFERAAAAFGLLTTAEGHFNRANALLLQGDYDGAIAAYDQALVQRPHWQPVIDNRNLAMARRALLAPPEDDAGGTSGKLGADEVVWDDTGRTRNAKGEEVIESGGELTDAQLRELWLRRVDTKPADFLRARFARQLARETAAGGAP